MPINVTGPGRLRIVATTTQFGIHEFPWGTDVGRSEQRFSPGGPGLVVFDDETVEIRGTYIATASATVLRFRRAAVRAAVETFASGQWSRATTMDTSRNGREISLSTSLRLPAGVEAFRVRVREARLLGAEEHDAGPLQASVRAAPAILSFIAMGGSASSGTDSASSGSSSGHGITVDASKCSVDSALISDLITAENIQCNDLCANCLNFIEHLGLRVLNDEDLASRMRSLRHKTSPNEPDFCATRSNPAGITHQIVLGKWENSEHEWLRPTDIKTFDSILDEYESAGGGHLLIVANSLAGAKLAATVDEHWRWGNAVTVKLFVAWDATHTGGGITSVGNRPQRVVNFFQTVNSLWFQNGSHIDEEDLVFDLTRCMSHNAIARSVFVHDRTYREVRRAIAEIRDEARNQ